jgi:hypothetical protein
MNGCSSSTVPDAAKGPLMSSSSIFRLDMAFYHWASSKRLAATWTIARGSWNPYCFSDPAVQKEDLLSIFERHQP